MASSLVLYGSRLSDASRVEASLAARRDPRRHPAPRGTSRLGGPSPGPSKLAAHGRSQCIDASAWPGLRPGEVFGGLAVIVFQPPQPRPYTSAMVMCSN